MPSFTINIPIRNADADDVKAAFASAYGYSPTILQGNGIVLNNPLTQEQFVQQCCINFMLDITKKYLVQVEEVAAREAASQAAAQRAIEVTTWFDDRRLESIGGIEVYNQFPKIEDIDVNCNQDNPYDIVLVGTDPDNLDLTFEIVSGPSHGELSGTQPNFVYTPNSGYSGTDAITYRATNGTKYSLTKTISIVINGVPVVQNMTVETSRNTNKSFTVTVNDYVDTGMVYTTVQAPANGVISGVAPNYVYEPYFDFHGTDIFQLKVNDGFFDSDVATITLVVNDAPTANNQILQVATNVSENITLTGSDPDGDQLTFSIVSSPSHGTLTGSSPTFVYAPNSDYTGTDSFTFVAFDGYAYSQLATVTLNIS
jgi:hypothetical protein